MTVAAGGGLSATERSYRLEIAANQVIFSGGRVPGQISSASFQRDSSYYSFRNTIDLIVATVRQQFYLVLLDRALIGVQEESVRLLQSQLQDQQNRFEAGTVPRFNVLQAQVALSNRSRSSLPRRIIIAYLSFSLRKRSALILTLGAEIRRRSKRWANCFTSAGDANYTGNRLGKRESAFY